MTTKSQNPVSFSRLSRLGLGLGLKPSNPAPHRGHGSEKEQNEDEWYIPYSGPYEPPREPFRRQKERDSWGDPIYGEDDEDDTVLTSIELNKRYGAGYNSHFDGQFDGVTGRNVEEEEENVSRARQRQRTQSGVSGRTVSSGTVDPTRTSMATQRRSTVSSSMRPPVSSYINLDAAGGVGESPIPLIHHRGSSKEHHRTSIAGLFSLGGQGRNKHVSERGTSGLFARKNSRSGRPLSGIAAGVGHTSVSHRRSSSSGSTPRIPRKANTHPYSGLQNGGAATNDEEDYYNSYYFSAAPPTPRLDTSITQPLQQHHSPSSSRARIEKTTSSPEPISPTAHPYAYAFPTSRANVGPQSAPLPLTHQSSTSSHHGHTHNVLEVAPRLTFTEPPQHQAHKPADASHSHFHLSHPLFRGVKQLKNSVSTPDLRLGTGLHSTMSSPSSGSRRITAKPPLPPRLRGKDRWLSAETWCDALLFPRPRLRIKQDGKYTGSGRIVSPPGSPVHRGFVQEDPAKAGQGMASRVLAHSRSLVDLGGKSSQSSVHGDGAIASRTVGTVPPVQTQDASAIPVIRTERPPRPKSFALDDLALPTPVPSLAQVLEDGQLLESQRKEWQAQATHSFQNKRTRTISRARSKSLTHKGRKPDEPPPSNIDFLAARACLGNQLLTPIIAAPDHTVTLGNSSSSDPSSRASHSHSNSLVKTLSKSSKAHSRTDSWSRSALRIAKTATCGLTGSDASFGTSSADNSTTSGGLEHALKRDGTRVIRLADPAQIPIDKGLSVEGTSSSPTPSGTGTTTSDARVGIALTTPPPMETSVDVDAMRLPAHPYAQGGLYSYSTFVPAPSSPEKKRESSSPTGHSSPHQHNISSEYGRAKNANVDAPPSLYKRPPPVANHPYAQHPPTRDSYISEERIIPHPREDSDVPPPAKMWAPWSPGVVREILPGDIQYSPFMSEKGDDSARNSRIINDMVGVGETLAYAVRPRASRDSGLGTSENHVVLDSSQQMAGTSSKRSYRQPVQYDATRPPYLSQASQKPSEPHSARTFASSPLLHSDTPLPDLPRNDFSQSVEILNVRTTSTSPESPSPPLSPHPIGNPDDLENFYDLFYKPKPPATHQFMEPSSVASSSTSLIGTHNRRGGSGLTSLARQLSEEFEHIALERDGSQYTRSSITDPLGSIARRPTDSTLEFVFEEASPPNDSTISAFQPSSAKIPEDVESSRASSPLEPDEDETELFRVGLVESVSTPPAVSSVHRTSFTGQLSFAQETHLRRRRESDTSPRSPQPRINSGLQPPSADPTRSSFTTTSTASRISGLSDFPAPPPRFHGHHMSLLSSYFEETISQREVRTSEDSTQHQITTSLDNVHRQSRRLTFGGDEDVEEIIATLSSHGHSLRSSSH
ncbi:hypothetical protein Hypma_005028 [Hypsizygus marmoreus]|uniref:Uncharacterized protein n=1 Tax=Hypsizygus marmoreus TaxID=39966 RepID=A0A369K7U4_HYPMA|nr:hypothetical protein Hypma_005028 [Hypsizygus marmoreus]